MILTGAEQKEIRTRWALEATWHVWLLGLFRRSLPNLLFATKWSALKRALQRSRRRKKNRNVKLVDQRLESMFFGSKMADIHKERNSRLVGSEQIREPLHGNLFAT